MVSPSNGRLYDSHYLVVEQKYIWTGYFYYIRPVSLLVVSFKTSCILICYDLLDRLWTSGWLDRCIGDEDYISSNKLNIAFTNNLEFLLYH